MSVSMRRDEQLLAKLNIKPEVKELLCWDFLRYLDFSESVSEVRGGPLLELISAHIRPNIDPGDDAKGNWRITATISADPPSGIYTLLSLPPHYPAFISNFDPDGYVPLPGMVVGPIMSFFPSFHAKVHVKDMVRDRVLVDAPFVLDYKDFNGFNRIQYTDVDGGYGTLRLKHITYQTALISAFSVTISRDVDDATNAQLMVSGTIIGSCHYDISNISATPFVQPSSPCIALFDSSYEVPVTLGQHMSLSLTGIAVPSYSNLSLHINLNVIGYGSVNKIAIFKGAHSSSRKNTIKGPQGLILKVTAQMYHECMTVSPMEDEVSDDKEAQASFSISPVEAIQAKVTDDKEGQASSSILPVEAIQAKVTIDEESQPSSFFLYKYWQPPQFLGDTLMEIFSTFITLRNDEPCRIHGRVEVFDVSHRDFCIYDHDDSNAEEIGGNNRSISLQGPHDNSFAFLWNELGMHIDLKAGDRQFCKGLVCWSPIAIREPLWLDNHMCSVVKGDLGYASVYYGIFKNAVQAKLRVYFLSSNVHTYVSGGIFGEHGNFFYSTQFEKDCYRSVIFSRAEEKAQVLSLVDERAMPLSPHCFKSERSKLLKVSGIELSLLKSVVVVPEDTCLVLDVDLLAKASIDGSSIEVAFKNRMEFEVGRQACWVGSNNNCQICVLLTGILCLRILGPGSNTSFRRLH